MLSGYNTNVPHRGVEFHVQTEDSGRAHPHLITHLYHGGTILASEKRSYADLLETPDLEDKLKELMEIQHLAMVERLRGGGLDDEIASRLGGIFEAVGGGGATGGATQPTVHPGADPDPSGAGERRPAVETPLDELVLDYLVNRAGRPSR